jgi:hypothetical protein
MAFDFLLWNCLLPGRTSIGESGKTASLKPLNDECVLTFHIDQQAFRDRFCGRDAKVCDGLFFYKQVDDAPVLLLVELKGADTDRAAEQLRDSLRVLQNELQKTGQRLKAEYRAIIVTRGSAPRNLKSFQKEFRQKYDASLDVSRRGDLRHYIGGR